MALSCPEEVDVFTIPHSRMKELVYTYLDMLPSTNFSNARQITDLLEILGKTFHEFIAHEQIENRFIMKKLKNKLRSLSIQNTAVCNCHKDNQLIDMLSLLEDGYKCTKKSAADMINFGIKLRHALEEFTETFLPHMAEEEEIFQPLLMQHFTFDELKQIKTTVIEQHFKVEVDETQEKFVQDNKSSKDPCKAKEKSSPVVHSAGFDCVPDELVLKILSHLNPRDLCRSAQVCTRWRRLTMDGSLWTELYPVSWAYGDWDARSGVYQEDSQRLAEKLKNKVQDEDADIDESEEWDTEAYEIQKQSRMLTSMCRHLLTRVGSSVRLCDLAYSKGITNGSLYKILSLCPNLKHLDLTQTRVSDLGFKGLQQKGCGQKLRHLDLSGCLYITDLTLQRLSAVFGQIPCHMTQTEDHVTDHVTSNNDLVTEETVSQSFENFFQLNRDAEMDMSDEKHNSDNVEEIKVTCCRNPVNNANDVSNCCNNKTVLKVEGNSHESGDIEINRLDQNQSPQTLERAACTCTVACIPTDQTENLKNGYKNTSNCCKASEDVGDTCETCDHSKGDIETKTTKKDCCQWTKCDTNSSQNKSLGQNYIVDNRSRTSNVDLLQLVDNDPESRSRTDNANSDNTRSETIDCVLSPHQENSLESNSRRSSRLMVENTGEITNKQKVDDYNRNRNEGSTFTASTEDIFCEVTVDESNKVNLTIGGEETPTDQNLGQTWLPDFILFPQKKDNDNEILKHYNKTEETDIDLSMNEETQNDFRDTGGSSKVSANDTGNTNERRVLEFLSLSGCYQITDEGLNYLTNNGGLPHLRHLDLSGCLYLGGDAVSQLVSTAPRLEPSNLFYCDNILDGPYADSASGCQNLQCESRMCCRCGE